MVKLGRNEPCPCGSGLKYKKCCLGTPRENMAPAQAKSSLRQAIDQITELAGKKKEKVLVLGVFVLFSTSKGDAWLLEVSEMDAVQLAHAGKTHEIELDETPEAIMVNWGYQFSLSDGQFVTTSYENKKKQRQKDCPVDRLEKAVAAIKKKLSPEILQELHLPTEA